MNISSEIFKGIKNVGMKKSAQIDLFPYGTELYEILDNKGLIQNLKETTLLGNIVIKNQEHYTRFDYVIMQLYMFQFVKQKINSDLRFSLGNDYKSKEFENMTCIICDSDFEKFPSIADSLQIMALIYNIGHFKNTFTSSRAMLEVLKSDKKLNDAFLSNFEFEYHKDIARNIINSNNYHRFHLLNSLLLLLDLDKSNVIVRFSINLLTEYLSPKDKQSEKTRYVFTLFKSIREICFVAMDLSIAPLPIFLDIHNDTHLKILLKERLADHNDQRQINNLFKGLNKLLQDTIYNEEENAIVQFDMARRMTQQVLKSKEIMDKISCNYLAFVNSVEGTDYDIFNRKYNKNNSFHNANVLKLSFDEKIQNNIEEVVKELNKKDFVKAAWYYRMNENKITILVTITNNAKNNLIKPSFNVMKMLLNLLTTFENQFPEDSFHNQKLLITKFFLYYLFDSNSNRIVLEGKLNRNICVLMDRGTKKRIDSIDDLLKKACIKSNNCSNDDIHEIEFLKEILSNDLRNDLTLTICSSVIVKNKDNKMLAEFDGLIIFPNRDKHQIVFVESKNTKENPSFSINCLKDKFNKLNILHNPENIENIGMNCKYTYSIF